MRVSARPQGDDFEAKGRERGEGGANGVATLRRFCAPASPPHSDALSCWMLLQMLLAQQLFQGVLHAVHVSGERGEHRENLPDLLLSLNFRLKGDSLADLHRRKGAWHHGAV